MAPQARWSANGFLPQLPVSLEQLDLLLLTVAKPRRVQQDGVRFQALRYIDPTLAAYVGEDVTIRYDPGIWPKSASIIRSVFSVGPCAKNSRGRPSVSKRSSARGAGVPGNSTSNLPCANP